MQLKSSAGLEPAARGGGWGESAAGNVLKSSAGLEPAARGDEHLMATTTYTVEILSALHSGRRRVSMLKSSASRGPAAIAHPPSPPPSGASKCGLKSSAGLEPAARRLAASDEGVEAGVEILSRS